MKRFALVLVVLSMALGSCGKSEEEKEKEVFDKALETVCQCYEKNKDDWLALKQECPQLNAGLLKMYADDKDKVAAINKKIQECDKSQEAAPK